MLQLEFGQIVFIMGISSLGKTQICPFSVFAAFGVPTQARTVGHAARTLFGIGSAPQLNTLILEVFPVGKSFDAVGILLLIRRTY